jgi:hypothetical protein
MGMAALAADTSSATVTYNKDVLPILQRNCQTCHRPGQIAPMSFLSYQSTRPWAKAMKAAVAARKMPPWFADSQVGHFLNDRSLKQSEIDTIAKWADGGAPEGDAKDAPAPLKWPEGWQIQPDVIVAGPVTDVPAHPKNNVIEWAWVAVPSGFTKDMWVTSIQIKPEHPEVTHHMCVAFKPHTADVKYNDPFWIDRERDEEPDQGQDAEDQRLEQREYGLERQGGELDGLPIHTLNLPHEARVSRPRLTHAVVAEGWKDARHRRGRRQGGPPSRSLSQRGFSRRDQWTSKCCGFRSRRGDRSA